MSPTAKRRLHLWYGIALAVLTAAVGVLFAAQAADLYFSGAGYSRELVTERLTSPAVAVPFWLWIAAIVAGGILTLLFPPEKKAIKRIPDDRKTALRLLSLAGEGESEEYRAAKAAVEKEGRARKIVWLSCFAVLAVCAAVALAFVFNFAAYPNVEDYPIEEPNAAVYAAILMLVRSVLPCAAVAFLACLGASVFDTISAKRILPQAKLLLAEGGRAKAALGCKETALDSPRFLLIARIAVLLIAAAFIIWGILNGGADELLA